MKKVGIIGGSGFAGEELIKFLSAHETSDLIAVSSRDRKDKKVADLVKDCNLNFVDPDDDIFFECDVVFFATPHGVSMKKAGSFLDRGIKVVDLSADYRLKDTGIWKEWYGSEHLDKENLRTAIYGLTELNTDQIKKANLIAVPGCYPTASILGLLPLMAGKYEISSISIDAKSGISGAGRSTVEKVLKNEIHENFRAYATSGHRHLPEIKQEIKKLSKNVSVTFIPHLLPIFSGIQSNIYLGTSKHSVDEIEEIIEKVINNNLDQKEQFLSGKDRLFGFFVGQVMKESKGKANPKLVNEILKKKLV